MILIICGITFVAFVVFAVWHMNKLAKEIDYLNVCRHCYHKSDCRYLRNDKFCFRIK